MALGQRLEKTIRTPGLTLAGETLALDLCGGLWLAPAPDARGVRPAPGEGVRLRGPLGPVPAALRHPRDPGLPARGRGPPRPGPGGGARRFLPRFARTRAHGARRPRHGGGAAGGARLGLDRGQPRPCGERGRRRALRRDPGARGPDPAARTEPRRARGRGRRPPAPLRQGRDAGSRRAPPLLRHRRAPHDHAGLRRLCGRAQRAQPGLRPRCFRRASRHISWGTAASSPSARGC